MYKILIVEDSKLQLAILKDCIENLIPDAYIYTAKSYQTALDILSQNNFDLFFLDILLSENNPKHNGINLAHNIRNTQKYKFTPIVFVTIDTSNLQYAVNHIHCYSYIVKPFNISDIKNALTSIKSVPSKKAEFFETKDKNGVSFPIYINDLLYIVAKKNITFLTTNTGTYTLRHNSLRKIMEKLGNNFIQCHRGQIVNIYRIKYYDKSEGKISIGNTSFSLSRTYKKNFEEKYNKLVDTI